CSQFHILFAPQFHIILACQAVALPCCSALKKRGNTYIFVTAAATPPPPGRIFCLYHLKLSLTATPPSPGRLFRDYFIYAYMKFCSRNTILKKIYIYFLRRTTPVEEGKQAVARATLAPSCAQCSGMQGQHHCLYSSH